MLNISTLLSGLEDVAAIRQFFKAPKTIKLLHSMGIEVRVFELHAPSASAKKAQGLGQTLCGRKNGMRHPQVSCRKCLMAIKKLQSDSHKF